MLLIFITRKSAFYYRFFINSLFDVLKPSLAYGVVKLDDSKIDFNSVFILTEKYLK